MWLAVSCVGLMDILGDLEQFGHWGDEQFSFEPRRFLFGSVCLHVNPLPSFLLADLDVAGDGVCCVVPDPLVTGWHNGHLLSEHEVDLRRFFTRVGAATSWAIMCERFAGEGREEITASASELFDCLDRAVRRPADIDVTLVRPRTGGPDQS